MSLIAFLAYALDKRAASRGSRRTPERVLQGLGLLGGWPGAVAAVYLLRHKSSKLRFKIVLWMIVAAHLVVWTYLVFRSSAVGAAAR